MSPRGIAANVSKRDKRERTEGKRTRVTVLEDLVGGVAPGEGVAVSGDPTHDVRTDVRHDVVFEAGAGDD